MHRLALVWFKRDLRMADHAPLHAAAQYPAAAALYVVEPQWVHSPECDAQHLAFAAEQVNALCSDLTARGLPLLIRWGSMPAVLAALRRDFPFTDLLSHEETGPLWSFARDRAVSAWCRSVGVCWQQWPQSGVIRGLRTRDGWAGRWQERMDAPLVSVPTRWAGAAGLATGAWPQREIASAGHGRARPLPPAGQAAAYRTLERFLTERAARYRQDLSSPLTAPEGCSRLSPYLAFGLLSMRQVHHATEARIRDLLAERSVSARRFAYSLRAFAARLRWHCHFMQKLESEPHIEVRNVARVYDGLREGHFEPRYLEAWRSGQTGYPMVDACMRCLNATGWLNFRMRAMLVSFAAYHLWLHWREPGLHLARQFLDFEPGIHWSQMQMQSGTTGINALRIYSPAKQQRDHDPRGEFIHRWVPEYGTSAYPAPIVEEHDALERARERMFSVRNTAAAREEAARVQHRHGSRRSGLPDTQRRRKPATRARTSPRQATLFTDESE